MGYVFGDQLDYVKELTPLFWLSLFLFASCLAYGYYTGSTLGLEILEEKLKTMPNIEGQSVPVVILVYFALYSSATSSWVCCPLCLASYLGYPR